MSICSLTTIFETIFTKSEIIKWLTKNHNLFNGEPKVTNDLITDLKQQLTTLTYLMPNLKHFIKSQFAECLT